MRSVTVYVGSFVGLVTLGVFTSYHGSNRSSTSAYCVDGQSSSTAGGQRVVADYYCDNGGSFGRYHWYYGGNYRGGYISRGTTVRPRGSRIATSGGRVISRGSGPVSRGGFGGHAGSRGG
jgi:hypothetical protein